MIIREGFKSLAPAEDMEEDMLDKAWGQEPVSRLSCQALVNNGYGGGDTQVHHQHGEGGVK